MSPSQPPPEDVLRAFERRDPACVPLTAADVADDVGCSPGAARDRLEELADAGRLASRPVDDARVWWRPAESARDDDSLSDLEQAQFEELVEQVVDYAIFVLDPDGTVRTWNEGARRLKGYEESDAVGDHFSKFYTEGDREDDRPGRNLRAAAELGRVEDTGWRVREDGSRFWANVVITALYDGDDLRGFAKVTRDMTERHEYEQALERERERLEFMNRIVRHNILNGLNVVHARSKIVQSRLSPDHPAHEHLDTVRRRVEDLTSLIETMRAFLNAVVSDADHELSPVVLRDELDAKVTLARASYPDADFETRDLPSPATRVVGDELVGEVFENVLSNAVLHNDAETPRVDVWTTETTREVAVDAETGEPLVTRRRDHAGGDVEVREWPAVAVHVRDNGPGVSDEQKEAILQKSVSRLEEPGSGFGLYLVTEMMDAYGGTVDVHDPEPADEESADPGGVVFTLTFLEADGTTAE